VAVGELLLEIPAGTLDVADDGTIEDPDLAARRELEEETGMRAGTWRKVARFYTAPGFASELMHLYLATDLTIADGERLGPDDDEHLLLERMPVSQAVVAAERGEFADAKSLVALLWLGRERAAAGAGTSVTGAGARAAVDRGGASSDSVTVSYQVTRGEFIRGGGALGRRSRLARLVGLVVIALGLQPIVTTPGGINPTFVVAALPLLVLGVLFVSGWFNSIILWYYARKRPELIEGQQTMTADDTGVRIRGQFGEGSARWDTYRKVSETGELFFLETGTGAVQLIAKSGFAPDQFVTFRRLAVRHGLMPPARER
jgi:ADP-ribose pyrophosphatase YjhB (NUDIX family)